MHVWGETLGWACKKGCSSLIADKMAYIKVFVGSLAVGRVLQRQIKRVKHSWLHGKRGFAAAGLFVWVWVCPTHSLLRNLDCRAAQTTERDREKKKGEETLHGRRHITCSPNHTQKEEEQILFKKKQETIVRKTKLGEEGETCSDMFLLPFASFQSKSIISRERERKRSIWTSARCYVSTLDKHGSVTFPPSVHTHCRQLWYWLGSSFIPAGVNTEIFKCVLDV